VETTSSLLGVNTLPSARITQNLVLTYAAADP